MPASKKNKENLKKAVAESYKKVEMDDPGRMKRLARMKLDTAKKESSPKPKKSREENRAAVQRTLKLLKKQKSKY